MTAPMECPFCIRLDEPSDLPRCGAAAVIADAYPRTPGHLLVVPIAHIADYFDLPANVKARMWALVDSARSYQQARHHPAGWTVRINIGVVAGQTVGHAHIHVVPRYLAAEPTSRPKERRAGSG